MADVLSQNEIDELLSAISTGVVSAENIKLEQKQKKIKLYDFNGLINFPRIKSAHCTCCMKTLRAFLTLTYQHI